MIGATRKPGRRAARWRLGRSGSALIEFALTAPILISLLLGVSDLAPSLMAKFKLGAATQAVGDLATLAPTMQPSDISEYFASGADVMAPFSSKGLLFRITNVASDGKGNAFVYWSCGQGMTPFSARSAITSTPTATPLAKLIKLGSGGLDTSYVMVESQYTYTAPARFILTGAQVMKGVSYTLPRVSTYIGPTNNLPNYVPIAPSATKVALPLIVGGVVCSVAY